MKYGFFHEKVLRLTKLGKISESGKEADSYFFMFLTIISKDCALFHVLMMKEASKHFQIKNKSTIKIMSRIFNTLCYSSIHFFFNSLPTSFFFDCALHITCTCISV